METVELYRAIGKMMRGQGAERIYLLRAKILTEGPCRMQLELAADGVWDMELAKSRCREAWPEISIRLLDLNAEENAELSEEVMEDGIQL